MIESLLTEQPNPASAHIDALPTVEMLRVINAEDRKVAEAVEREIAAIERASAALRRAEPELESWANPPPSVGLAKPQPVWLLVGALWLSTALVTIGAAFAISVLVG